MEYYWWLMVISIGVALLELCWPARKQQKIRPWIWSDCIHLVFNGHFLGAWLYLISVNHIVPVLDSMLVNLEWFELIYRSAAQELPLWLQVLLTIVVVDFVHWNIHRLLHRVELLWRFHQVHHSVKDGEMDWIVAFRFSWVEPVVYKSLSYLPLAWLGFLPEAIFAHAVFGTLIGHLNHSNLSWDYGPLRYVLNSPKMHLHHHSYDAPEHGHNFGIILSCWDWIFQTAHLPSEAPKRLGFRGEEAVPQDFLGHMSWPISLFIDEEGTNWKRSLLGAGVFGVLYVASSTLLFSGAIS